jgi:2-methylisocitrate lyase-like PEP mutase family enzyme
MQRKTWKELLKTQSPLILPAAHDALTAKLIEQAGFPAYQVGGFALSAVYCGLPDMGFTCYGEESQAVRQIMQGSTLPVLVDADDGYGDGKNVTRTVQGYEHLGVAALFFEDQKAPKRCGHLPGKKLLPVEIMVNKLKAALAARRDQNTFIMARTDAIATDGMDEAIKRGNMYLDTGVDGLYTEAPETEDELEEIGKVFGSVPLAVSYMSGGGKMPWFTPKELHQMGYSMILYSTSLLFPMISAAQQALFKLREGQDTSGVSMDEFSKLMGIPEWNALEQKFPSQE